MKTDTPAVTVIVPVFNGERYLDDAIRSVLSQSFSDFELLVLDDGSNDRSREIIESFQDERLRVVSKSNEGLCKTLNAAISLAKANVIARLDQDDVALPGRIEKEYRALVKGGYDCVFCNLFKFSRSDELIVNDKVDISGRGVRPFLPESDGCIVHSTLMARKSVLEALQYRPEYYPADDWDLTLRMFEACKVGVVEEALVGYRIHLSANTYKHFSKMQFAMRWANANHVRRTQGQEEIPFEEYARSYKRNWCKYANRQRKDYGKLFMRKAGDLYLHRHRCRSMGFLLISFLLRPWVSVSRLYRICCGKWCR